MIDVEGAQAQMMLDIAAREFEDMFAAVEKGNPARYSQTGEEYTEFTNDGPKSDGESCQVYDFATDKRVPGRTVHLDAGDAVKQWFEEAQKYAEKFNYVSSTLYWRIRPEIEFSQFSIEAQNGMFVLPTWKIYSRFLISDKPRKDK